MPHLSRYTSFFVKPEQAQNLTPDEIEMMRLYADYQRRSHEFAKEQRDRAKRIGVQF